MLEALQFEYMRNALMAALLGSIACGVIGSYVVVKRIGYISGGIAHATFGGIGLGYFLGVNPLYCLIPFSLASAWGIGLVSRKANVSEDTAIGLFWAVGMALGVIFIGLTPGYVPDLFSYLFGNILTVPRLDIYFMIGLDLFVLLTVFLFYREFLAVSFDEEYARASGVKTLFIYLLILNLVAITVVMLVRIVGIILVIALLTIPPAIAQQHTDNLLKMMGLSVLLGGLLNVGGLWLSYTLDLASGATIILLLAVAFLCSTIIKKLKV
ncbi:metal ABC transporter permease [Thermodesulfobacteriota bacterium]